MSQEKFTEILGSTLPYINQLENGKRKPKLKLLDKDNNHCYLNNQLK